MNLEFEDDVIDKVLTDLGLTKYEAMIYRALIKLGEAKALEIAQTSGVPREKTYQVLRELEDKDIVKRIEGKPRKWVAMPPHAIFEDVITEKKKTITKMEETIKALQNLYEKGFRRTERKDLNVWEIGESSFEESFYSTLNYAHLNIYALLTPFSLDNLTYNMDLIKKLYKKDLDIKILTWMYEDNLHDIAKMRQYVEVYILPDYPSDISFYIIDGKTGYIIRDGKEYIIQYSDSRIAHFITEMFNKLLQTAVDAEECIEYWEAVETLENSQILYASENIRMLDEMISNIIRGELRKKVEDGAVPAAVRSVLKKYIPNYDHLHIESKIQLINILLKKDPLFSNIKVSLDIPTETLVIDVSIDGDPEWVYEVREYNHILPPSPYLMLIHDELRKMGWKEVHTIWLEDKKPLRPYEPRKIKIIKKYEKPL